MALYTCQNAQNGCAPASGCAAGANEENTCGNVAGASDCGCGSVAGTSDVTADKCAKSEFLLFVALILLLIVFLA